MTAPTILTDRLILSPPDPVRDLDEMTAMYADPAVSSRVARGQLGPREDIWQRLIRYVGHWQVLGYGNWTVRERAGDRYVGSVGLFDNHREIVPPYPGTPEAGWVVAIELRGRGYATEALAAMFAWADARPIEHIVCMIAPDNALSIRLAERLGFRPLADTNYHGEPVSLYQRSRAARA